jgi:hypothetical protein
MGNGEIGKGLLFWRLEARLPGSIAIGGRVWSIAFPQEWWDKLTPDTAPELERRLKKAFEILEGKE